jgi:autotransporter-associated beta strand protein
MKIRRLICCSALLATASFAPARAQQLFPDLLTPSFRGDAGTEFTHWDIFLEAYAAPNSGDQAAAASDPTLTQTLTSSAFLTSGFNIYSFAAATGYELANDVSSTLGSPLTNLVFQYDTLGTAIDFDSIQLNYSGGTLTLAEANVITEYRIITGGFGGFTNRTAIQWDLTGLSITDYTITFESLGSSNSFNAAMLDTSINAYAEIVPSSRIWDNGAGDGKWGSAANWSGNTVTTTGGNVTIDSSAPSAIELDGSREVGLLTLTKSGAFNLAPSGGAALTINTGITADGGSGANHLVSAPIFMGGHNFMDVKAGTTLTLSGTISGAAAVGGYPAAGLYKEGAGTLVLSGNNDFAGGLTVDGGVLISSGTSSYAGATTVFEGSLVLQGNAPNGANGTLGNSTTNVTVGYDPGTTPGLPAAQVFIDGNFTVGRTLSLSAGTLQKVIGGRNTTSALYSGNVLLATTTDNTFLRAEAATDVVTFSGQITGGGTTKTLTKDGAGTVIFSGVTKNYASATVVSAGTLQVASGTAATGNGSMTIASGATLLVHGSLSGSGALAINGGTVGGNGTISRTFTLDTGDVLSPGASVGTLSTIGETWAGGGRLRLEISDVDAGEGLGWDLVNLTGALSITATTGSKFTLEIDSLTLGNAAGLIHDWNANSSYSWKFLGASAAGSGFDAGAFAFDTSGFQNTLNGSFSVSQAGNDLFLNYTAVPEPSSALLGLSAAFLFLNRRRRAAHNH